MKFYILLLLAEFCSLALSANYYNVRYTFDDKLDDWKAQLQSHDRMPPTTYVQFLAFKKLVRDFDPIQAEMLQATIEAEREKNTGLKEEIIASSASANREIEKRTLIHRPFFEAMRKKKM